MSETVKHGSDFVYYEVTKREVNSRRIYECRCDERLKPKDEGSTRLTYTGFEGNETDPIMIFQFITTDKAKASRGGG